MTRTISTTSQMKRHSIASGEMDFEEAEHESAEVAASVVQAGSPSAGRNRSLSATWGEIFGTPSAGRRTTGKGDGKRARSGSEEVE